MGLECLRNYNNINGGPNIDYKHVKGTEIEVELKISGFNFKTIIDRLDEKDGILEIHDYKTGKPKTSLMLKNDLQLFIYLKAVKSIYKTNREIGLNWHYLKERTKEKQHIRIVNTDEDIKKKEIEIVKRIEQIMSTYDSNKFSPKPSFLCHWCYLWNECEEKKQYNESNPSINAK